MVKYKEAVAAFLNVLTWQAWGEATSLDDLDVQVSEYIEYLWDTGWGTRNMAGFVISGAGHFFFFFFKKKGSHSLLKLRLVERMGKTRKNTHKRPHSHYKPGQRWQGGLRCSITLSGQ